MAAGQHGSWEADRAAARDVTRKPKRNRHAVALWGAITALLTNLAAIRLVQALHGTELATIGSAIVVSFVVGGVCYSKGRYDEAKEERWEQSYEERPPRAQD